MRLSVRGCAARRAQVSNAVLSRSTASRQMWRSLFEATDRTRSGEDQHACVRFDSRDSRSAGHRHGNHARDHGLATPTPTARHVVDRCVRNGSISSSRTGCSGSSRCSFDRSGIPQQVNIGGSEDSASRRRRTVATSPHALISRSPSAVRRRRQGAKERSHPGRWSLLRSMRCSHGQPPVLWIANIKSLVRAGRANDRLRMLKRRRAGWLRFEPARIAARNASSQVRWEAPHGFRTKQKRQRPKPLPPWIETLLRLRTFYGYRRSSNGCGSSRATCRSCR